MAKEGKSENLSALEYYERRRQIEQKFFSTTTSCFKCSKANPTEIILDQSRLRQYMNYDILFVHDQEFNCEIHKAKNRPYILHCKSGNKLAPEKCSTCKNAIDPMTVKYMSFNITKTTIEEMRVVYRCKENLEPGHYYRSTFSCDKYEEK